MKIAILSYFNGLVYRGAETYADSLSRHLVNLGHEVTLYQNGSSKELPYKTSYLASQLFLPRFDPIPDVVISVNGRVQAIKSRIWTLLNRKKLIISGQSGPGADDKINLYSFPDIFVGLTESQCLWAKKTNPFAKVAKIPNGVDHNMFSPDIPPVTHDLPGPVVLCVAALEPIKRLDLAIKAAAMTKASLLIVGVGSLQDELWKMGSQFMPGRFKILSFTHDQMPGVYSACDVFVYPTSPFESFGIAMIEAMASNLPIVATNDPIRKEIIGNAGIVCDPVDPNAFSQAINSALARDWQDSPLKRSQDFTWETIGKKYDHLIKNLYL